MEVTNLGYLDDCSCTNPTRVGASLWLSIYSGMPCFQVIKSTKHGLLHAVMHSRKLEDYSVKINV
jgi:hypothetical protein